MTRSIPKLAPEDIIEWPDGERAKVVWISEDGERFRVKGLPTLLRLSRQGLADAIADDRRLPGGQRSARRTGLRLVTSKFTCTAQGCGLDFHSGQSVEEFRAGDVGRVLNVDLY